MTSKLVGWSDKIIARRLAAYAAIIALQVRVIWGIWQHKDLVSGDTSSYFLDAVSWTHGWHDDIVWSPLYTDTWGTIYALLRGNPYASEMVLRVAVVLVAAVLVLAIMRSLLDPPLALLTAAWWTVVPANYNSLYEVHLFGVLPILATALIVAKRQTPGALGVALAILLATAILLRNETLLTALILTALLIRHEVRKRRSARASQTAYLRDYGVPLLLLIALVGGVYWRSFDQGHNLALSFKAKQDLNLCQAYTFNYQQRHPAKFTGNPFTECQPLMKQVFGRAEPSFLGATLADPRAMAAFAAWNARLLGSGLQVALFNATSTGDQPDYIPVETERSYALISSLILLALWVVGLLVVRRDLDYWRRTWLPPRKWVVVILGAECVTTIAVALSERPRPEYMYALTISFMAFTGVCAMALLRRRRLARFMSPMAVGLTVGLIALLPSHYQQGHRPLYDAVNRLQVVRSRLRRPGSVLIAAQFNSELCNYLAETYAQHCSSTTFAPVETALSKGLSLQGALARTKATAIYAERLLLSEPMIARLVSAPSLYGWRQVASGTGDDGPWHVLVAAN